MNALPVLRSKIASRAVAVLAERGPMTMRELTAEVYGDGARFRVDPQHALKCALIYSAPRLAAQGWQIEADTSGGQRSAKRRLRRLS